MSVYVLLPPPPFNLNGKKLEALLSALVCVCVCL